jgi:hypothetical protein
LLGYRISSFLEGAVRPVWSKSYESAGKVPRAGAYLIWAGRSPDQAYSDVQQLSFLDGDLLVCAGAVQDLVCLFTATGNERWRVPKIWKIQRGFVGPSVWQHYFTRGPIAGGKKAGKKTEEARETTAEKDRYEAIVGGPIVVEAVKGKEKMRSLFVAVTKGPADYASYLGDCVVYELDGGGHPLGMAWLPRMVLGGRFRVQKDGLVWACQQNAFVKLAMTTRREQAFGMGPGGPDLLCRVDWYRQIETEVPDAWLRSDPAGSPLALGESHAFRVTAGGYIPDQEAHRYRFPISIIDLKTGVDQSVTLDVPFKGELPKPGSNCRIFYGSDGKEKYETHGPYVLAITSLRVENQRLQVTLGMEKWARTLNFDLESVIGLGKK